MASQPEILGALNQHEVVANHGPSGEPALYESEISAEAWRTVVMLLIVMGFAGYAAAIPTIAAPWFSKDFHLSDPAMARVFAGFALSSFGALGLARMADRVGRRRVLMWAAVAMPLGAIAASLAGNIFAFVGSIIVVEAFIGAALTCSVVMIAEILPVPRRAAGQSWAGLASAVGGGLCVFMAPVLAGFEMSWRLLMMIPVAGLFVLPAAVRRIPESARWEHKVGQADDAAGHFYDIFGSRYWRRGITILVCSLLAAISVEGVNSYSYFHAVAVIGLSPDFASAFTIIGGGLGMVGFPLGAWAAERYGRIPTIVASGVVSSAIALAYFWGPPGHFEHPAIWLGAAFLLMNATANATLVSAYAAITELFPTGLRGTIMGWSALMTAFGALAAESTIAALAAAMGGISIVTGWLSLLGIPAAILFGVVIEETRGLALDEVENRRVEEAVAEAD